MSPSESSPRPKYAPPISQTLAGKAIQHFMTQKVVCASPTTSVRLAMRMLLTHKISGLPVIDRNEICLGVYSEVDAMIQGASDQLDAPIRYTQPPITALPTAPFREVLLMMVKKKLKRLPIVDARKRLLGIVSRRDLMKALLDDADKSSAAGAPT
jgi:CBS domain-containing protein